MRSRGVKLLPIVILLCWLAASLIDCPVGRLPARVQLTDRQASFDPNAPLIGLVVDWIFCRFAAQTGGLADWLAGRPFSWWPAKHGNIPLELKKPGPRHSSPLESYN